MSILVTPWAFERMSRIPKLKVVLWNDLSCTKPHFSSFWILCSLSSPFFIQNPFIFSCYQSTISAIVKNIINSSSVVLHYTSCSMSRIMPGRLIGSEVQKLNGRCPKHIFFPKHFFKDRVEVALEIEGYHKTPATLENAGLHYQPYEPSCYLFLYEESFKYKLGVIVKSRKRKLSSNHKSILTNVSKMTKLTSVTYHNSGPPTLWNWKDSGTVDSHLCTNSIKLVNCFCQLRTFSFTHVFAETETHVLDTILACSTFHIFASFESSITLHSSYKLSIPRTHREFSCKNI